MVISACAPSAVGTAPNSTSSASALSIVGFAVPKAAHDAAQAAFAEKGTTNKTTWTASYGASGDQSRAVASGLETDVVHFSLEGDLTRLVDAGIVEKTWQDNSYNGIISTSVVVLAVREGNPKNIQNWDDLLRDDVTIVTPNPGSSGSARWNILAAYGSVLAQGGSTEDARTYLRDFFNNVAALPGSGRDATAAFTSGTGDVLISYENEAILARQNGEKLDYVIPRSTLLIENPAAVTKDAPPAATAYLDFIASPEGQNIFAQKGFRPLSPAVKTDSVKGAHDPANPFPAPQTLQTINDTFGGWETVNSTFFGDNGLVTAIQLEAGKL